MPTYRLKSVCYTPGRGTTMHSAPFEAENDETAVRYARRLPPEIMVVDATRLMLLAPSGAVLWQVAEATRRPEGDRSPGFYAAEG